MAQKIYVGISNVAKNVNKIYVGVGNVAKKVLKGYVGVNGVAKQFYEETSPVPPYTQVNYIESTGTQYINTGIYPNSTTRIKFKFQTPTATQGGSGVDTAFALITQYFSGAFRCFSPLSVYLSGGNYLFAIYKTTQNGSLWNTPQDTNMHEIDYGYISNNSIHASYDNVDKGSLASYTETFTHPLRLFTRNWGGTLTPRKIQTLLLSTL